MKCSRCKDKEGTRKLSAVLRYLLIPLWPFLYIQSSYRQAFIEATKVYCSDCARILNTCLFFVFFMFILFPILVAITD